MVLGAYGWPWASISTINQAAEFLAICLLVLINVCVYGVE